MAPGVVSLEIEAPRIAKAALPGQFVIVRADERGERIPLTLSDWDAGKGTVRLVIQTVGYSTGKICSLKAGDSLADVAGPLGRPSELTELPAERLRGTSILFVAGGVGAAPVYAQVKWLRGQGTPADVIVGAKSAGNLILTEELKAQAAGLYIATDDGSAGYKGLVTELMKDLVERQGRRYDLVVAIGPMIMMKFAALAAAGLGIRSVVSLKTLMVDGTGMCGACRVTVGGRTKFACVDGPEFDGAEVDFDAAMRRQGMYRDMEKLAAEGHRCRIGLGRGRTERND